MFNDRTCNELPMTLPGGDGEEELDDLSLEVWNSLREETELLVSTALVEVWQVPPHSQTLLRVSILLLLGDDSFLAQELL